MSKITRLDSFYTTINQIIGLYERFKENGDLERAEKTERLLKKLNNHEFIVAFCGHFSAGKSTMINNLLGEDVLPSSPIPTSANLVKVHRAKEDFAKVYYADDTPLLFQAPYDFQLVKEYCKHGDVKEIEIGKTKTELTNGMTVMDTPGVDSTDDAHRISTESAIHLADIVFYVMDYNHVQSELNFMYTKELLNHGVELYLIINQIDKHKEEELSFHDFQKSVRESFSSWNVHPKGIFYTTLKDKDFPNNQFITVKNQIESAIKEKDVRIDKSAQSAMNILVQEHYKWLRDEQEENSLEYVEIVNENSNGETDEILTQESRLIAQKEEINNHIVNWKKYFNSERDKILENALLMPYQTRELAESYLKSMQDDFKVGVLFGKKKTEQERHSRLETFYENVFEQFNSQIIWHLHSFANNVIKESKLNVDHLNLLAQQFTDNLTFDKNILEETVKKGARITGEYVLNYCSELAEKIKKVAFQACESFKQSVLDELEKENKSKRIKVEKELEVIIKAANAIRMIDDLKNQRIQKEENIYKPIENPDVIYHELQLKWDKNEENVRIYSEKWESNKKVEKINYKRSFFETESENKDYSVENTIRRMEETVSLLKNKNGFSRLINTLKEKAERLKNKQYTIALFGAFSAGKSSFANALLGEKVLPVSPNPTTAAINRICPPTNEHSHGTAIVRLKTELQLLEDVQNSLKEFGIHCNNLQEAQNEIPKLIKDTNGEGREKIHLSFLNAFSKGYNQYQEKLGLDIKTGIDEFRGFVANESQSCFVDSIDLFYDSELTRMGVTLVDTPGADSINARHTGVAFEYIKNADAVLFVTYYNHAFSKADREFLIQLGRVKDAFELDKMFFVVNAIDLAQSEQELDDVLNYVDEQLVQYGIRFPRLFGVSSLLALKKLDESRIHDFQKSFYEFLEKDLMKMAIQSAEAEIERGIQMIKHIISSAQESKDEKNKKYQLLLSQQVQMSKLLVDSTDDVIKDKLIQEQKELLYYVKQRVFYRFSDFFKEAFNPSLLQKGNKQALNIALNELLESLGFDFAQEMRATSLRLELFMKNLFSDRFNQLKSILLEIQPDITLGNYELMGLTTPEFQPAFNNIDKSNLEKSFKYFKSAKSFFEKNEKKLMQDELELNLQPAAEEYLLIQKDTILDAFLPFIEREYINMKNEIQSDLDEQFTSWYEVLNEEVDIEEWKKIYKMLAI